jgi:hypothetical protein
VPQRQGDLARGLARLAGTDAAAPPASHAALPATEQTAVVLSAVADADALVAFEAAWLAPAVAALESAHLRSLALIGDAGGGAAHLWRAGCPTWSARLAARLSAPAFLPPVGEAQA